MPVHDWTRVEAGVFHHFHRAWIEEMTRTLNGGLLPPDYYAMAEQHAAGFGPDVLTLQTDGGNGDGTQPAGAQALSGTALLTMPPRVRLTAEADPEYYRRKQSLVVVRHVTGDRMVAAIEVVSPGNKATRSALQSLVEKAMQLLDRRIHLLILDLIPPGRRDPRGVHGAIWEDLTAQEYQAPAELPLTLVAYQSALTVRAYIEPVSVGQPLPDMPLYVEPEAYVLVPLERTYEAAFAALPRRWRTVWEQ